MIVYNPPRYMVAASVGAKASITVKEMIEASYNVLFIGPSRQGQGYIVEGPVHIEGRSNRVARHPENSKPPVIREQIGRTHFINVFGRQCDAR